MMSRRTSRKALPQLLGNIFSVGLVIVILFKSLAASTATDGSTPLGLTPGAPAGSYPLSGLDHMNLYNGNMSFNLPLIGIGGRGSAGYSINRIIEQHWRVDHVTLSDGRQLNIPLFNPWTPVSPEYGPGVVYGRQVSDGSCAQSLPNASTLTRLTFVGADGTEHELLDKNTMGEPRISLCAVWPGFARGTVFVSTNGEAMTFVSDSTIYDNPLGTSTVYATGYLMMADGTRLRIVNGIAQWLRDRNGNQISITYPTSSRMIATDPLGRQVIVDKNVSDVAPYGLCDKITFNGFNGTQRYIRVSKKNLGNALHSGWSLQTPASLFPQLDGSSSTYHDPPVVSAIWLPDGRSYQFRYNSYGELARVELPTGGAFEYDYAAGLVSGAASGFFYSPMFGRAEIYRRSIEKRVYKENGVLEHKTTTSRTDSLSSNDTTVTVDTLSPTNALLTRSKHYFFGNPAQSFDLELFQNPKWKHGREYKTEAFNSNGTTVLRRVEHTWQQPVAGGAWPLWQPETNDSAKPNNPQITDTRTTIEPATANQVSMQLFAYDLFLNPIDVWEYGFGNGGAAGAMRHTQTSFLITNPVNSLDYASPNPTASSIHIRNLPQNRRVYTYIPSTGQETLASEVEFVYDETALNPWYGSVAQWTSPGTARGNATKIKTWLNPGNTWLESRLQFDQVGNVSKSWDHKNNQTEVTYSATYQFAYPTQTTSAVPDPTGAYGSNTALVSSASYDLSTGLMTASTDVNNQITNMSYSDPLNRPTQVIRGVGTSAQSQTTLTYDDNNRTMTVTSDLHGYNDNVLKSETVYDGLGRTIKTRQYEGGPNHIQRETQYDALGRPHMASNPFRPLIESAVWTMTQFDALGRPTSITTPDTAAVTYSYSGTSVTVTDQAGKVKKTLMDALGRVAAVYEDPNGLNYASTYEYDALDNLVKVTQGSQQRFFMYDSLRRLIRARNPEQGTNGSLALSDLISGNSSWSSGYQYDANSNLTAKTDARGVVSTYAYDALNRNTTINYSDTTTINPDVKRFYDGATNGKGRFWYFYSGGDFSTGANVDHTSVDSYDALGRPLVQRQLFKLNSVWSPTYQTSRTYNRAGAVTSQTYPSGRSVTYNYDPAGRLGDKDASNLAFSGNLGDNVQRTYARGITYSHWGSLSREQYGTNIAVYNKRHYNIRAQLCDVRASNVNDEWGGELGALVNYYSTTWAHCGSGIDNNGNVLMSQTIINSYYMEDRYSYDALNRLTAVNEWQNGATNTGSQQYDYDRWGNRTIKPASWGIGINTKQFTVDAVTNRLGVPGGQSGVMTYDNAGNLITDTYTGAGGRTYDAKNKMTSAWGGNNQWQYYTYNADGQRTRRKIDNQETWQLYGFDGELLAEYAANAAAASPQTENGYRNGQLLVQAKPETVWSDDAVPAGAAIAGDAEGWNWVSSGPSPFSGSTAHQSNIVAGLHQHYFYGATATLTVNAGDKLFAYVYLDPSNMPSQIMLQWAEGGSWEHRAYWGANNLPWGVDGTNSRRYMGPLPAAGSWVKLEVPASLVGLEGYTLHGMAFSMWGGRATWDRAGKTSSVQWLVSDHLGTPRMVIDVTGTLANIKRHDYLPFGEELFAPAGGRSTSLGYAGGDGVRQQFTQQERDLETGLDYFNARYYSSAQGRFTSPDQPFADQEEDDPQSWNLYTFVRNNPLRYVDPFGDAHLDANGNWVGDKDGECDKGMGACWRVDSATALGGYWDFGGNQTPVTVHMSNLFHDTIAFELMRQRNLDLADLETDLDYEPQVYEAGAGLGRLVAMGAAAIRLARATSRLDKAMRARGIIRSLGTHAHHIVARGARQAALSRKILRRFRVDVDDADNGVYLAQGVHQGLHTNVYYAKVERLLSAASTKDEVVAVLSYIASELQAGRF